MYKGYFNILLLFCKAIFGDNQFTFYFFWVIIFVATHILTGGDGVPQDAFTIKYVAAELNALLCGGKISKIVQYDRDSLTFIIYTRGGTVKLDI